MIVLSQPMKRRSFLKGMLGGAAVTVGLPYLDCFLNTNGDALASGEKLPLVFGTWFAGLGFQQGFWEPKTVGANYEMAPQLKALAPLRNKINIFSGLKVYQDGGSIAAHATVPIVCALGDAKNDPSLPSIDSLIAENIGGATRFRSLEVACHGSPESQSRRSATSLNPGEVSPVALYQRIFGADFTDPNADNFTPSPAVMVRHSALSAVTEQRAALLSKIGAADKARVDEFFTSLREMENQLQLQMQKPAPLPSCSIPAKLEKEATPGVILPDAMKNHELFAQLLSHAVACGQTNVVNIMMSRATSVLRKQGSADTFHTLTHEEVTDTTLGYQPKVYEFQEHMVQALYTLIAAFDGIKEGPNTLLDRSLIYYYSDCGYAKFHTSDNVPVITAGGASGRFKTGIHVAAKGESITRVGLTVQRGMEMRIDNWGKGTNQVAKPFAEVLA